MSEWKEQEISELAELRKDSWKVGDEQLPYIALEHIVENGLRLEGIGDSSIVASNKYYFDSDNFLFGKLRPYFRKLFRPNFKGICSTDIWVVKPKGENEKDFLFYFFANQEFIDHSYSGSSGTRMPRADWNFVSKTIWKFPEPKEQRAIASVLSSLDDKIDLLHRQNATLEKMAETLFREWFVEKANDDWEEGVLGDLVEVKYGKDHKKLSDGQIPVYGSGGFMRAVERPIFEGESVLIPRKGTLNNVMYVDEAFWTVDTMFYTIMKRNHLAKFIYQSIKQKDLASMNVGSAVPSMTTAVLNNMPIEIPPEELLHKFDSVVSDFYNKIKTNQTQIRTLRALRDTLLPKLMSGEVRIKS
ncbi:restriction endonuclease subunit S [Sinomicrobium sp.]